MCSGVIIAGQVLDQYDRLLRGEQVRLEHNPCLPWVEDLVDRPATDRNTDG